MRIGDTAIIYDELLRRPELWAVVEAEWSARGRPQGRHGRLSRTARRQNK